MLITGAAGFIGFHLAKRLLDDGRRVVGIDTFGESAPAGELFKLFGFTAENVGEAIDAVRGRRFNLVYPFYLERGGTA